MNGARDETKMRIEPIVISCAKIDALGQTDVIFQDNGSHIIEPAPLSEPTVVAYG
jgi:lipid A disaccharide synthetase